MQGDDVDDRQERQNEHPYDEGPLERTHACKSRLKAGHVSLPEPAYFYRSVSPETRA